MKKIIAILTAFFLLLATAPSRADYTEWKDSTYDFTKNAAIYIGEMDTSAIADISPAGEWKRKETFCALPLWTGTEWRRRNAN